MKCLEIENCGVLIAKVYEDGTVEWAVKDEGVYIGYGPIVEDAKKNFDNYVGKETLVPKPLFTFIKG